MAQAWLVLLPHRSGLEASTFPTSWCPQGLLQPILTSLHLQFLANSSLWTIFMMISHISACMKPSASYTPALECCVRASVFLFSMLLCSIHLIQPKQNNFAWHAQHTLALLWTHPSHVVGILGCSETLRTNPQSPLLCFLLEVISYMVFSWLSGKTETEVLQHSQICLFPVALICHSAAISSLSGQ